MTLSAPSCYPQIGNLDENAGFQFVLNDSLPPMIVICNLVVSDLTSGSILLLWALLQVGKDDGMCRLPFLFPLSLFILPFPEVKISAAGSTHGRGWTSAGKGCAAFLDEASAAHR